ncbi:hypothetical protein AAG570_010098 [Ranatra chinensis]|uniref:Uncharacterized protein n=1 Tax=Ranatra chinensis TaxID=642074 RepID=A0ABD0YLZ1_9HEMI
MYIYGGLSSFALSSSLKVGSGQLCRTVLLGSQLMLRVAKMAISRNRFGWTNSEQETTDYVLGSGAGSAAGRLHLDYISWTSNGVAVGECERGQARAKCCLALLPRRLSGTHRVLLFQSSVRGDFVQIGWRDFEKILWLILQNTLFLPPGPPRRRKRRKRNRDGRSLPEELEESEDAGGLGRRRGVATLWQARVEGGGGVDGAGAGGGGAPQETIKGQGRLATRQSHRKLPPRVFSYCASSLYPTTQGEHTRASATSIYTRKKEPPSVDYNANRVFPKSKLKVFHKVGFENSHEQLDVLPAGPRRDLGPAQCPEELLSKDNIDRKATVEPFGTGWTLWATEDTERIGAFYG